MSLTARALRSRYNTHVCLWRFVLAQRVCSADSALCSDTPVCGIDVFGKTVARKETYGFLCSFLRPSKEKSSTYMELIDWHQFLFVLFGEYGVLGVLLVLLWFGGLLSFGDTVT